MAKVNGVVTKVYEKREKKDGTPMRNPSYSIQINDDKYYSCGFKHPGVQEGQVIEFEASSGKFGLEADTDSVVVVEKADQKVTAKGAVNDYNNKQNSIVYQSCLKVSAELVSAMLAKEILPIPSAKNKVVDAVVAMTEEIASTLAAKAIAPTFNEESADPVDDDE